MPVIAGALFIGLSLGLLGSGGWLLTVPTQLPQTALKRVFSAVVATMAVLVTLEATHIL